MLDYFENNDEWLKPFKKEINKRRKYFQEKEWQIIKNSGSISDFANGHLFYGLHKYEDKWCFREWAPNAEKIYILGDFNNWQIEEKYCLTKSAENFWIELPLNLLEHKMCYKLYVVWDGGESYRIPSHTKRVVQNPETLEYNAQIWNPEKDYLWKNNRPSGMENLLIYEVHIGMATEEEKVGSFKEFTKNILPEIKEKGYKAVQIMGLMEHPYYASFGYQVTNFFALSSRFGTPEDFKELVDTAHSFGLKVIMDLIHSHSSANHLEGLALFDGTSYQYFHEGSKGEHPAWDSKCFDYGKDQVLAFLLSSVKFWLTEYHLDGFRFDGVTSMIYYNHGLGVDFTSYEQYFDQNQDLDALTYLYLTNILVHDEVPSALTIAEEMSGYPGLACATEAGGLGFDYRMAMGVPDYWIRLIKEVEDEFWQVGDIFYQLTSKRREEKVISYVESHDQALVGDKTLIFRMLNDLMYNKMDFENCTIEVERAIHLINIIKLLTASLAGGGYLNFMGNEFGHPEWIDFPREGNNWSFSKAKRLWSLGRNKKLLYHLIGNFDKDLLGFLDKIDGFFQLPATKVFESKIKQVLIYERGSYLFCVNLNSSVSFPDFEFAYKFKSAELVFTTEDKKYFGHSRLSKGTVYQRTDNKTLKVYLPTRSALIIKKK